MKEAKQQKQVKGKRFATCLDLMGFAAPSPSLPTLCMASAIMSPIRRDGQPHGRVADGSSCQILPGHRVTIGAIVQHCDSALGTLSL
jgi:hypothetical protein